MSSDDVHPRYKVSIQSIGTLRGHDWEVSVHLSPNGTRLISVTMSLHNYLVYLWDTRQQKLLRVLEGHQGPIQDIAYAPDGNTFATACNDGLTRVWTSDGDLLATLPGHKEGAKSVEFVSDSSLIFTGDGTGIVRLWDVPTQQLLISLSGSPKIKSVDEQQIPENLSKKNAIRYMAYSPAQMVLAIEHSSSFGDIHLWRFNRERLELQWIGTSIQCKYSQFVFSPDGRVLALLDGEKENGSLRLRTGRLFEIETQIALPPSWEFSRGLIQISFSPDGRYLAIGGYDGEVGFWDLWHQMPVATYRAYVSLSYEAAPFPSLTGLDWSSNGLIATGGWEPMGDTTLVKNNFVATLWDVKIEENG